MRCFIRRLPLRTESSLSTLESNPNISTAPHQSVRWSQPASLSRSMAVAPQSPSSQICLSTKTASRNPALLPQCPVLQILHILPLPSNRPLVLRQCRPIFPLLPRLVNPPVHLSHQILVVLPIQNEPPSPVPGPLYPPSIMRLRLQPSLVRAAQHLQCLKSFLLRFPRPIPDHIRTRPNHMVRVLLRQQCQKNLHHNVRLIPQRRVHNLREYRRPSVHGAIQSNLSTAVNSGLCVDI